MKEIYDDLALAVIEFEAEDVIVTSVTVEDETPKQDP